MAWVNVGAGTGSSGEFGNRLRCDHRRHRYGERRFAVIIVIVFVAVIVIVGREEMNLNAIVSTFSTRRWEKCRRWMKQAVRAVAVIVFVIVVLVVLVVVIMG